MATAKHRPRKPRARRPSRRAARSKRNTEVFDADALLAELRAQGFRHAKIGGFDIDGVLRGKYVSFDKLSSALKKGFGFCDVIFGWDVADVLYDNAKVTGWHTGYPDAHAVLDPSTLRTIPWEDAVAAMLCDFRDAAGRPHPACPRSLLKRVVARSEAAGFTPKFGAEFEFFLFRETRDTLRQKNFHDLCPLDPGMFGYSWVRSGQESELMRDILDGMSAFDIEIEGLHTETGPGVYEAALRYDDAVRAADKAALFKTAMKQIAHRHGLSVTFMAKWNARLPGCSGHLHQSLWHDGKNVFYDARAPRGMSRLMRHYIAGQMALMQEFTSLYSPTVNSYKRYVPGLWAPLIASWGVENRTCAIRIIGTDSPALRVEYRQTAADINPYIAMAASLGAGLWGIERKLELGAETHGDPGLEGPLRLPTTLGEAVSRLETSRAARALFGAEFVDHYARTRRWEARCFETAVTDWELERYFEPI
jgi:glutamine synthetase